MAAERDRRTGLDIVVEGDEAGFQRRMGDRRDSPRIPLKMMVRFPEAGGSFEEREGDIAMGGVFFREDHSPQGNKVEVRFRLPALENEARCEGEIIRVAPESEGGFAVHVRFAELPVELELALARFIDDQELKKKG